MLPPLGHQIDKLPVKLQFVRDLEAYEGPILSEYRAPEGGTVYVEKWCAYQDDISRFLIVRSDPGDVTEFLAGRLSMLDLLTKKSEGCCFLVDRSRGEIVATWHAVISEVPRGYLPKPSCFHDEALGPEDEGPFAESV